MKNFIVLSMLLSTQAFAIVVPQVTFDNSIEGAKGALQEMCVLETTTVDGKAFGPGKRIGVTRCWDSTAITMWVKTKYSLCIAVCEREEVTQVEPKTIQEINGLKWQLIEGIHDNENLNGSQPIQGIIQKSHATELCRALGDGWHLPLKEEFEKLGDGYRKLQLPEGKYWSAQLNTNAHFHFTVGYVLNTKTGLIEDTEMPDSRDSVVCVSAP